MSYLSKSYRIVFDRAVDTPGHGKDVGDGFNAFQKRYLATCLRMRSTPEKDNIDIKRMRAEAMTEKGEVSFAKECKRLLDLQDQIGTKGDKKHAKREFKTRLNHKYYWIHKEEDTLFNSMKAIYKILNNKYKVTMKNFYHIRCNPDLEEGFCAMRRIPCACSGCVEQLYKPWLPNLDKRKNYVMLLNKKHVCTIQSYMAIITGILPNLIKKINNKPI